MKIPTTSLDSIHDADLDREVGDLLFLWNREGHVQVGWQYSYARNIHDQSAPTKVFDAHAASEGASGIFLEFVQDPKKGKAPLEDARDLAQWARRRLDDQRQVVQARMDVRSG
jgi:hypothetical protein